MNLETFLSHMQADIRNEYKHMLFYLYAGIVLRGPERIYAGKWLADQAEEEMGHVRQFSDKIRAFGLMPVTTDGEHPLQNVKDPSLTKIFMLARELEEEVIANYHKRLVEAAELHEKTGKYYDFVLFYEEQLEHSQADVDEIVKFLQTYRT